MQRDIFNLHPMSLQMEWNSFHNTVNSNFQVGLSLTESNRNHVLQIVNTLDRIPLAIELVMGLEKC